MGGAKNPPLFHVSPPDKVNSMLPPSVEIPVLQLDVKMQPLNLGLGFDQSVCRDHSQALHMREAGYQVLTGLSLWPVNHTHYTNKLGD